jgi:hypothetical protein
MALDLFSRAQSASGRAAPPSHLGQKLGDLSGVHAALSRAVRVRIPLAAGAVVMLLAGCGSPKPTKAEYIAQADKVCRSAQDELRGSTQPLQAALQRGGSPEQVLPRISSGLESAERAAREQVDKLSATPRPAGRAGEEAADYVNAVKGNLEIIEDLRKEADQVDLPGFQKAGEKLGHAGQRTNRLAGEYGFRVCGRTGA